MTITLRRDAPMREYQQYIHELETAQGWLGVDLILNCFLMGEEVGELFKAVRKYTRTFEAAEQPDSERIADVAEELVDVFNYLLAVANRLDIDLEAAFRSKNRENQQRTWG